MGLSENVSSFPLLWVLAPHMGVSFCTAPVLGLLCFLLLETDSRVAQAGLEPPVRLRMSSVSESHC